MDDDYRISLSEWCSQEVKLMFQFASDWEKKNKKDPEEWPMDQSPGEWDEQFRIWHDSCEE